MGETVWERRGGGRRIVGRMRKRVEGQGKMERRMGKKDGMEGENEEKRKGRVVSKRRKDI